MTARVQPVYRTIVKKNERQGDRYFDVLICKHSVLVDASTRANTYRRARACPTCRARVQAFADHHSQSKEKNRGR